MSPKLHMPLLQLQYSSGAFLPKEFEQSAFQSGEGLNSLILLVNLLASYYKIPDVIQKKGYLYEKP